MYSTDVTRDSNGRSTTTTVYLGNVEHVIAQNGSSTYKRYLANGSVFARMGSGRTMHNGEAVQLT